MEPTNGNQAPSPARDFDGALNEAEQTGNFEFVMQTAKDSDKMLREFKQAVTITSFPGRDARAVAMGLNFLDNMIAQSAAQLEKLKRTEKVTREAIKAAQRNRNMTVVGPEDVPAPEVPAQDPPETTPEPTEPSAPAVPEETLVEPTLEVPPAASAEGGWETPPNA